MRKREEGEEVLRRMSQQMQGESCTELCLAALDMATGMAIARDLAEEARLAALLGLNPLDAAAIAFSMELRRAEEKDCPDRAIVARVLSITAVELSNLLGAQGLLLLLAPTIACVGDEALDFLDTIAPAIGEELAARIAAALEEGAVAVGNVVIKFPPVNLPR